MKTVLCFGDSNTWGQVPLKNFVKQRYPRDVRWTGLLEILSNQKIIVIEEGNNGRTTGVDDPLRTGRNGLSYLPACLDSAVPLDLVIIMLGTNDLKMKYEPDPKEITERLKNLIQITKNICPSPPNDAFQILIISPPVIKPEFYVHGDFNYPDAVSFSKSLAAHYKELSDTERIHFLSAEEHAEVSVEDGAHLDAENHRKLAAAVWEKVQKILGGV